MPTGRFHVFQYHRALWAELESDEWQISFEFHTYNSCVFIQLESSCSRRIKSPELNDELVPSWWESGETIDEFRSHTLTPVLRLRNACDRSATKFAWIGVVGLW